MRKEDILLIFPISKRGSSVRPFKLLIVLFFYNVPWYQVVPGISVQGASLRGRHSPPANACSGRKNINTYEVRFIIDSRCNWRLENAKSPAAMLRENNPDATCIVCRVLCTWYHLRCIYTRTSVSKLVTTNTELLFSLYLG